MKVEFINSNTDVAKVDKCVIRESFRFLCDDSSVAEHQISSAAEERLLKIMLCDDVDVFWIEMERRFNEIICAAQKDDIAMSSSFPLLYQWRILCRLLPAVYPNVQPFQLMNGCASKSGLRTQQLLKYCTIQVYSPLNLSCKPDKSEAHMMLSGSVSTCYVC